MTTARSIAGGNIRRRLQPIAPGCIGRGHGNIQAGAYIVLKRKGHSCQKSETTRNDRAFTV